jgi:nicotinamide mononucleotide transporter
MPFFISVDNIALNILGYQLSYIELFGTLLYLWSVWLISKRNILTWPIGILSVLLYMVLFYQIHLYSDTFEQIYYLGASIFGWWVWNKSPKENGKIMDVKYSTYKSIVFWVIITAVISIVTGYFMSNIHNILPVIFPEPASFPYLDAATTIMSFTAMWLMARKRIESWIYWIIVDVIGIWLYFIKEVKFISLLYIILLIMAVNGLLGWSKVNRKQILNDDLEASPHPII